MSLVNWRLTPGRVELMTDTLAFDLSYQGLWNTTKFFMVPHAGLLIADVGPAMTAFELQKRAMSCDLSGGIDDLEVLLPGWAADIHADFIAEHGDRLDSDKDQDGWNLVAFGYSTQRKRMAGIIVNGCDGFAAKPVADGEAFYPPLTDEYVDRTDPRVRAVLDKHRRELARFKSPDSFIAGARLQQLAFHRLRGGGSGGDLLLATLTRQRIEVKQIGRLPELDVEPEEVCHAVA